VLFWTSFGSVKLVCCRVALADVRRLVWRWNHMNWWSVYLVFCCRERGFFGVRRRRCWIFFSDVVVVVLEVEGEGIYIVF
jgi:hypothetical protein